METNIAPLQSFDPYQVAGYSPDHFTIVMGLYSCKRDVYYIQFLFAIFEACSIMTVSNLRKTKKSVVYVNIMQHLQETCQEGN